MIDDTILNIVEREIKKNGTGDETVRKLQADHKEIMIKKDLDDYIIEVDPVRECDSFNLYLIDISGECHTLTNVRENAGGVLIGIVENED